MTVANLEKRLRSDPDDRIAASNLLRILDFHVPTDRGLGAFSECHQVLAKYHQDREWNDTFSDPAAVAAYFKQLNSALDSTGLKPRVAIAQLFAGQFHSIHETQAHCGLHLSLFKKDGVISQICHDCYKVQVLPLDLMTFVRTYFALRSLQLPRDNCRKCMVEMREDIAYPYKGYIYCESEDEALFCRSVLQQTLEAHEISDVYCGISHGCSEFGLKYPGFKYSNDGSHRTFERPGSWDRLEAEFFARNQKPQRFRKDFNHDGITLSDLVGLRTWVAYAELIGDEACWQFQDGPTTEKPQPFATLATKQARMRQDELQELAVRIASRP